MYKGIIASLNFSIQEFAVLLSCCKVKTIYGLFTKDMFELQKNDVENIVFALTKKGILTVKDNVIEVRSDVRKYIYSFANYKKVISITSSNEFLPERSLYVSDVLLEIIFKGLETDRIMIIVSDKDQLTERLEECGFGIDSFIDREVSDKECTDKKILKTAKKLATSKREDVLKTEGVVSLASVHDKEGTHQLILFKQEFDKYIFIDSEVHHYSKDKLSEIVSKFVEG